MGAYLGNHVVDFLHFGKHINMVKWTSPAKFQHVPSNGWAVFYPNNSVSMETNSPMGLPRSPPRSVNGRGVSTQTNIMKTPIIVWCITICPPSLRKRSKWIPHHLSVPSSDLNTSNYSGLVRIEHYQGCPMGALVETCDPLCTMLKHYHHRGGGHLVLCTYTDIKICMM